MTPVVPGGPAGADPGATGDDAACMRAAKQLRSEHPMWIIIWVARTRLYRAFPLSASWGAPGLTDTQPAGLAAQIEQAERAATQRRRPPPGPGSPARS